MLPSMTINFVKKARIRGYGERPHVPVPEEFMVLILCFRTTPVPAGMIVRDIPPAQVSFIPLNGNGLFYRNSIVCGQFSSTKILTFILSLRTLAYHSPICSSTDDCHRPNFPFRFAYRSQEILHPRPVSPTASRIADRVQLFCVPHRAVQRRIRREPSDGTGRDSGIHAVVAQLGNV